MSMGTVKWFNATKGYGFIQPDDGGADVFVHISAVERSGLGSVNEGQKLSYDMETGRDGKAKAINLVADSFGRGSIDEGDETWIASEQAW